MICWTGAIGSARTDNASEARRFERQAGKVTASGNCKNGPRICFRNAAFLFLVCLFVSLAGCASDDQAGTDSGSGDINSEAEAFMSDYSVTLPPELNVDGIDYTTSTEGQVTPQNAAAQGDNHFSSDNSQEALEVRILSTVTNKALRAGGTNTLSVKALVVNTNGATVLQLTNSGSDGDYQLFAGTVSLASGLNYISAVILVDNTPVKKTGFVKVEVTASAVSVYSVLYDANGAVAGSVPVDSAEYSNGAIVSVLDNTGNLSNTGYAFGGWTNSAGTLYTAGETFTMGSADVTMHARWQSAGSKTPYTVQEISFGMIYIPGGITFFTNTDASGLATVDDAFELGETEVTYEQWYAVYTWATNHDYSFKNAGQEGHDGTEGAPPTADKLEPVTFISWQDAVVWCNALTAYYNASATINLGFVYTNGYGGQMTNANNGAQCSNLAPLATADGFRLPTTYEWELAARYIQDADGDSYITNTNTAEYYPGNFASGADADAGSTATLDYDGDGKTNSTTDIAWCDYQPSTYTVGTAGGAGTALAGNANALGFFDMSGNVAEWCFEWKGSFAQRILRGGYYSQQAALVELADIDGIDQDSTGPYYGFRIARSVE